MGRVTEQFNPDAASSSLQGGDLSQVKNTAGSRHNRAVTTLEVIGGGAALVTVLAGCDVIGNITAAGAETPGTSSTPDTTPSQADIAALKTLESKFTSLDMSKFVAEDMWLMTDRPDANAFYVTVTNNVPHKHLEQPAFDLISQIKQNKEFQKEVAAILADPNAVAQLKSSDIPSANADGTVSMDIAHQGAWAELHKLTPEQIQQHNATTLANLQYSINHPQAFDGDSSNAFKDKNGNVYADGTLIESSLYHSDTKKTSIFFNDYNVRNVGTVLDAKGNPEYWILKQGSNKYLVLNFADMPQIINISTTDTAGGVGGGNRTGNPYYISYEVGKIFGNTDDPNVKGLALNIGFDPTDPQVNQLIKAMQGHGTSPNLMTDAQVKDLISGKTKLGSDGVAPANLDISVNDEYLLNH